MTIEIDIPETLAQEIQTLPRERVNNFAVAGIRRGLTQTNGHAQEMALSPERRREILADLFRQAEELVPEPPQRPLTAFERGLQEKFRKQGFDFPETPKTK